MLAVKSFAKGRENIRRWIAQQAYSELNVEPPTSDLTQTVKTTGQVDMLTLIRVINYTKKNGQTTNTRYQS